MAFPRPRFRLRTMLVVVTLLSVWLGWSAHWSRQRKGILDGCAVYAEHHLTRGRFANFDGHPPLSLWLFEPHGVKSIYLGQTTGDEFERAVRLFPEAAWIYGIDAKGRTLLKMESSLR